MRTWLLSNEPGDAVEPMFSCLGGEERLGHHVLARDESEREAWKLSHVDKLRNCLCDVKRGWEGTEAAR